MLGPRDPDEYLLPTERRVIQVRRHWAALGRVFGETVGILVLAMGLGYLLSRLDADTRWLQTVLWYGSLLVVVRFIIHALQWWIERIVVTDKRFMATTGLLETKISLMPITKVTDLSYTRPVMGRLLGYGILRVESAGQKQDLEKISYLPQPEEVYGAISQLIFGEKGPAALKGNPQGVRSRNPTLPPPGAKARR